MMKIEREVAVGDRAYARGAPRTLRPTPDPKTITVIAAIVSENKLKTYSIHTHFNALYFKC